MTPPWRHYARRQQRRSPVAMHGGIALRGPARRHARRRLHRGVKELVFGAGKPRGVQLGVAGPDHGAEQLGAGWQRAWGSLA
jgi:hypothetical protein